MNGSKGTMIGFVDKNGLPLRENQVVKTFDRTGKKWIGEIVPVDPDRVISSSIMKSGGVLYAFESNYQTWINNQEYASELEIIQE